MLGNIFQQNTKLKNIWQILTQSLEEQSDQNSKMIVQKFIEYGSNLDSNACILTASDAKQVKDLLSVDKENYVIKFLCEFGCALVFKKELDWKRVSMDLVFPTAWNFQSSISASNLIFYPYQPLSFETLSIGKLTSVEKDLKQILSDFQKIYQFFKRMALVQEETNRRKNHHTPSWMYQLLLMVFDRLEHSYQKNQPIQIDEEESQKSIVVKSKGGTLDVGMHTGITKPSTSMPVAYAVINYLLGVSNDENRELIQIFQASYSLFLIYNIKSSVLRISADTPLPNIQIIWLKKILVKIKNLHKIGVSFNHNNLNQMIELITRNQSDMPLFPSSNQIRQIENQLVFLNMLEAQTWSVASAINANHQNAQNPISSYQLLKTKLGNSMRAITMLNGQLEKVFKKLLEYEKVLKQQKWILLVETTFFKIMESIQQANQFTLNLENMNEQLTSLLSILGLYEKKMRQQKPQKNYSGSKNQGESLIHLIKLIGCIFVFQIVRKNRKSLNSNLEQYRIPYDDEQILIENFSSLSFEARQSLEKVVLYLSKNKGKKKLFVLQNSSKSYQKFVLEVYQDNLDMQTWLTEKKNQLERSKANISRDLKNFHQNLERIVNQIILIAKEACSCTYHYYGRSYYTIQCQRCKKKKMKQNLRQSRENEKQNRIKSDIPEQQKGQHVYAFMMNIPKQIEVMIEIFHMLYGVQQDNRINFSNGNAVSTDKYGCIRPYAADCKNSKFEKVKYTQQDVDALVIYPSANAIITNNGSVHPKGFQTKAFQLDSKNLVIDWAAKSPNLDEHREHQIYSQLDEAKKFKLKTDEFVNLCSIRVGLRTQIPILCENLLSRKISINFQKTESFQLAYEVLIRAVSSYVAHKFNPCLPNQPRETPEIIEDSMRQLLSDYHKLWNYSEVNSLVLFGPLMSLFSKYIKYEGKAGPLQLLRCAYKEFLKLNDELREDEGKTIQIRSTQALIAFGGLCCLTEPYLSQSETEQEIQMYEFLIVLGHCSIVFMNQNVQKSKNYEIIQKYSFLNTRSKFFNMEQVLAYFKRKPNSLNKIVKFIDEGCSQATEWQYFQLCGQYCFKGTHTVNAKTSEYLLNIQSGVLLKNGKQLTGLSSVIKNNQYFKEIFNNRDFQVYHGPQFCRTKRGFENLFPQSQDYKSTVFFQFKQQIGLFFNQKVVIRLVQRKQKAGLVTQQSFTLLQRSALEKCNFAIPPLFLKGCLGWYSEESSCIVFRLPQLENLSKIQMVMFLKSDLKIEQAILVPNESKNRPLHEIIRMKDTYQQIIFKKQFKVESLIVSQKILHKIEDPPFIIRLKEEKTLKLWLHRYDLIFRIENGNLVPEGYGNYVVEYKKTSIQGCPWTEKNNLRAICIRKAKETALNSMQNQYKFIISNLNVNQKGLIPLPQDFNRKISTFTYDVHDHFKDLRGGTIQANLHLASLLISFQIQESINKISRTPNQYCLSLIRSCYNTRPLTASERSKIKWIIFHALQKKNCTILLACQVLLQCTKSLNSLYFPGQIKQENNKILNFYASKFSIAKREYYQQILELTELQRLNQMELQVLRMNPPNMKRYRAIQKWKEIHPLKLTINAQTVSSITNKYDDIFKKTQEFYNKVVNLQEADNPETNDTLKQIQQKMHEAEMIFDDKMNKQAEKSLMLQEAIEQEKQSCQIYTVVIQRNSKMKISSKKAQFQLLRSSIQKQSQGLKKEIQNFIIETTKKISSHIDVRSQLIPKLHPFHYSRIVCEGKSYLKIFCPDPTDEEYQLIRRVLQVWIKIVVELDSLKRLKFLLNTEEDLRGIRRQVLSPRVQITKFKPWVCFQAEMRIKIWASQYQTYEDLCNSENRSYSQLNMGQGKTQVIIPMFVLQKLFCQNISKRRVPRINLLSALIDQSRLNYFRFFSATSFRIPCLEIPFNRAVDLNEQNIRFVKSGISPFLPRCVIILDRQSCLSMTLKIREVNEKATQNNTGVSNYLKKEKQYWLFGDTKIFDILDEVDALVTPNKSFVYSIGGSDSLPDSNSRIQLCRYFIQIFVKQMLVLCLKEEIITCESQEDLIKARDQGTFCRLRYIAAGDEKKVRFFRTKLLQLFLSKKYLPENFSFYETLSEEQASLLKKYFIDQKQSEQLLSRIPVPKLALSQIYAVRGILAYGILEHCLSLRCGVDFGVPGKEHPKRVGVPYEAADVPSKRSQYAHPDVSAILSYISRYVSGLTKQQFIDCITRLLELNQSSKKASYRQWLNQLSPSARNKLNRQDITKINLKSNIQINQLFDCFHKCRPAIAFWLRRIVFPSDLRQYTQSITASSWDIANAKQSIGFSGTKDSRVVFPSQLNWVPSHNFEIKGTNGKNIAMLLSQAKLVIQISDNSENTELTSVWERFISKSLKEGITCIIDAGALLVGKSIKKQIAPWIGELLIKMKSNLKGITYPNQRGKWEVYDFQSKTYIERNTRIPEHQTFVIFDEARTRGSDIKMSNNVCAALTLSPNMTQLQLMQAMGRLRNIEAGQTIKIFGTTQILQKIEGFAKDQPTKNQIKAIIKWVIKNSVKQNEKLFHYNTRLGWLHFRSINLGMRPHIQKFNPTLQAMYKNSLTEETPCNINRKIMSELPENQSGILQNPTAKKLFNHIEKYGNDFRIKCQGFDDVCEREVEMVEEVEEEEETEKCNCTPLPQNQSIKICRMNNISTLPYSFTQKLSVSYNFRNCTNSNMLNSNHTEQSTNKYNELMYINFALISKSGICLITQRQANILMKEGVKWVYGKTVVEDLGDIGEVGEVGVGKIGDFGGIGEVGLGWVVRFCDLGVGGTIVRLLELEEALVQAAFFNGHQIFSKEKLEGQSEESLSEFQILRKMLRKNRTLGLTEWQPKLQQLSSHFLDRRRIFADKYQQSSLHKLYISLRNDRI